MTTMNTRIGIIFATVAMLLITAACCTPRSTRKWKAHSSTDDTAMAATVLPSPNTGKNAPSVDLMRMK
ncbi:hypothetical protein D3C76_1858610 [compost metagenome]